MGKSKLPYEMKQECLWIVRGYEQRARAYCAARREIMEGTYCGYKTIRDQTGEEIRVAIRGNQDTNRSVENKALLLAAMEKWPEIQKMRAVEQAKELIGADISNKEGRVRLQNAILLNCKSGRRYPFRFLDVSGISERDFYRRKDTFLCTIAKKLHMI